MGLPNYPWRLDQAIRAQLLTNRIDELPAAKPLIDAYRGLEIEVPVARRVPTLAEWKGQDQPLFTRGNHKQPAGRVPRRFLEAIDATPYGSPLSGRRELANDLIRDDNPFTRRVIVNRLWHYLFGAGLVPTVDNFGRLGSSPSHPELLDYLANRFGTTDGWSIKEMVRFLVTSETWQQASQPSAVAIAKDPENRLWSHASVRRLEAEAIRDAMLATDGRLDLKPFGTPVGGDSNRRSVYVNVIRNRLDPFLQAFNAPVPFGAKGRRDVTNVPAQSLLMMNDPFVVRSAQAFAKSSDAAPSDRERITTMWQRALGRDPGERETTAAMAFLDEMRSEYARQRDGGSRAQQRSTELKDAIDSILDPIRQRLLAAQDEGSAGPVNLAPMAVWEFEGDARDSLGRLDCELMDGARIENGALLLDGNGWARTAALPATPIIDHA